jgi:hypothetical protein
LRARAENRSTEQAIAALTVPSSKLGSIPLENVATFAPGLAPPTSIAWRASGR